MVFFMYVWKWVKSDLTVQNRLRVITSVCSRIRTRERWAHQHLSIITPLFIIVSGPAKGPKTCLKWTAGELSILQQLILNWLDFPSQCFAFAHHCPKPYLLSPICSTLVSNCISFSNFISCFLPQLLQILILLLCMRLYHSWHTHLCVHRSDATSLIQGTFIKSLQP